MTIQQNINTMEKMNIKHIAYMTFWGIVAAVAFAASASCSREDMGGGGPDGQAYTLTVGVDDYLSGSGTAAGDTGPQRIGACIFRDGKLAEIFPELGRVGGGYSVAPESRSGTMYVLGDCSAVLDPGSLEIGMSEDRWLATVTGTEEAVMYYTGSVTLDGSGGSSLPVTLTRGLARFDLELRTSAPASVGRVTFSGVMDRAFVFPQSTVSSPQGSVPGERTVSFGTPPAESTSGIAYLYEQSGKDLAVTVSASIGGSAYVRTVALPEQIKRNTVYSIIVSQDASSSGIELEVVEWGEGSSDLVPDLGTRITVDSGRSTLSEGVEISSDGLVVAMPYTDADCILALDCSEEIECVTAPGDGVTVEAVTAADGVTGTNMFRIRKQWWRLGVPGRTVTLQFRRKGLELVYPDDSISVVLAENPTGIGGMLDFTDGYRYDFGRYVDNELGVLTLPEGKQASVEFAEGEDPWIRLDAAGDGTGRVRVLGGWKPNDRTADGRVQSATIVLCDEADGGRREEYTVSRRNWGLPVTYLNGIWWCKYNAMGNSKSFEDQILSSEDPAALAGKTVFEYLETCSPQEYFDLWKWEYQGDSGMGLEVKDIDGVASLDGFSSDVTVHMNTLDPHVLAPDGYEVPSFDDFGRIFNSTGGYIWIMWDGSHTSPWNGGTLIQRRNKRRNDVTVGSIALDNLFYMAMYTEDGSGNEPVVWYGAGAQWNDSGVKHAHYNSILFTVYSPEKKGWYFNGNMDAYYITQNGAGNKDTRILRFRKSDVEYIIPE